MRPAYLQPFLHSMSWRFCVVHPPNSFMYLRAAGFKTIQPTHIFFSSREGEIMKVNSLDVFRESSSTIDRVPEAPCIRLESCLHD
jgi:hypothetical protein